MEEIFGVDMDVIMVVVLAAFVAILVGVGATALLDRVIFKIGLRNIPRRPAQTTLIIIGLMLSTLIISAALGTGDTINFSIRSQVYSALGEVDEAVAAVRGQESLDVFGGMGGALPSPYFPEERFGQLRQSLVGADTVDGLVALIAEQAPAVDVQTRQSEGQMRVRALDPASAASFGPILTASGPPADLAALAEGEVFLNATAAEALDAAPGHELRLFFRGQAIPLRVRDIVQKGGLAGNDPTVLFPLSTGQRIFNRPGQINTIFVSNRGDSQDGARRSQEVTEHLRALLTDEAVARELHSTLSAPAVVGAVRERADAQRQAGLKRDLTDLATLLEGQALTPRLRSLLADDGVSAQVQLAVGSLGDQSLTGRVSGLLDRLSVLNVGDIKADALDQADLASSAISSVFVLFGMFSMMAGVMLIFLIFVMLAAERRPEMGIARAIGMKRRHLVQSFLYEGLAYDLLSALAGALLGVAVGFALVTLMVGIFGGQEEDFVLRRYYHPRSFIVAYCTGVVLTFATVLFSSYRASRLNIVAAIRNLSEVFAASRPEPRLRLLLRALAGPVPHLWRALRALAHLRVRAFLGQLLGGLGRLLLWPLSVAWGVVRLASPAMAQGWLTFVLGWLLVFLGIQADQVAPYTIGVTAIVIGMAQMMRRLFIRRRWPAAVQDRFTAGAIWAVCLFWLAAGIVQSLPFTIAVAVAVAAFEALRQVAMARERVVTDPEDRNAYTFAGLSLFLFWGTPFDSLDFAVPEMSSSIEMFFISGISLVTAAVWVVVYNSDLLVNGVTAVFGRFSRLRPALKTAVAYALSSRLRTGLTLAMLALVIFTLIVMSMLTTTFGSALGDTESVTGGWDVVGAVSFNNPIGNIQEEMQGALGQRAADIEAVGGYITLPVEVRQIGASSQEWRGYNVRAADRSFLENSSYGFRLFSSQYGSSKEDIWRALRETPGLAVVDSLAVPTRQGGGFVVGGPQFRLEGFFLEDKDMPPTQIEVRDPRTGATARLTVIGVLDALADQFGVVIFSKEAVDQGLPAPLPVTTYRFKLAPGADASAAASAIEAAFLEHGMETEVLAETIEEGRQQNIAINRLLQGFMASGLMVGIAALGVISFRAVVERRQQIGVLRAIGYRQWMVLATFLMESSFIALLGIMLGVGLGLLLSYNLVSFLSEQVPGLRFTVPWLQLTIIVVLAYLFSLLTTWVPARQASRVYPAEALRYE